MRDYLPRCSGLPDCAAIGCAEPVQGAGCDLYVTHQRFVARFGRWLDGWDASGLAATRAVSFDVARADWGDAVRRHVQ
jgi:hypothetical protein